MTILTFTGASVGTPPPGLRSPLSDSGLDHHPLPPFPRRYSQTSEASARGRFQPPGMAELSLQDRSLPTDYQHTRIGQKRRANSPPPAGPPPTQSPNTQQHAWSQVAGSRSSQPPPRYPPQAASGMSSAASSVMPQNSYMSSSFTPSQPSTAATSYSEHYAPVPYQAPHGSSHPPPLIPQYHAPPLISPTQPIHGMGAPPIPQRRTAVGAAKASGLWICECCPKKPRKFDTEHDLR